MTPPRSETSKATWRAWLSAARRDRTDGERRAAHDAISGYLLAAARELTLARHGGVTVCVYLPLASEPLTPELPGLLAAMGNRVLVPITTRGRPLDWAELPAGDAGLVPGPFGIAEPAGARLGPDAITTADLVIVPALAADRRGVRLGRGGGFYDRSLRLLPAQWPGRAIAVLFDDEFVDRLPSDPHDVPVDAVVTPSRGIFDIRRG